MDPKPQPVQQADDESQEVEVLDDVVDSQDPVTIDPVEEDKTAAEFKQLDNKAFAAMRKEASDAKKALAEREKKIAELEARANQPVQAAPQAPAPNPNRRMISGVVVPETREEWDALARKDWQLAVDMRSIMNTQRLQEEAKRSERSMSTLEESKQEALEAHPELNDPTTEKARIFSAILQRNPEYAQLPEGPIIVMHKMEREMRKQGFTEAEIRGGSPAKAAPADTTRVSRAALTAGGRMPEKQGRTVTLSKEDLEFCKSHDLDPKEYAKEKLAQESRSKGAQL